MEQLSKKNPFLLSMNGFPVSEEQMLNSLHGVQFILEPGDYKIIFALEEKNR
jgi:hypothetical protein